MTLRTTALIAGALGLLLLIGGLIADAMRPASFGTPSAAVDTPVLLIGPAMVAMAPGGSITVEADGELVVYAGRTEDAEDWAATRDATVLTGVPTWEELSTEPFVADEAATAEPSASPDASASATDEPSAEASASASTEPEASASASPEPSASAEEAPIADIWRASWDGDGSLTLDVDDLSESYLGLTLVVEAADGGSLTEVTMTIDRVVNDGWVTPLKWWGGALAVAGLIALVSLLVDHRNAGSKVETAVAGRKATPPATPGGRRERRETATATGGIPVVDAEADPTTGEVPRTDEPSEPTAGDDAPPAGTADGEERP
ncbi:hypothetical protein QQX09_03015 [Demequina sp. SYSU T00192]|uniref:Uncharacterized protein n=1 Tax=Demequina litoralis TaxID=3051660 RepID=A0ABT8G6P6_9MICO|nr:hypothetical protein [Demequina sp. SYSU T00192]MDN4474823.1 hypothetical protein [Demequina sp. SYSU T00192]